MVLIKLNNASHLLYWFHKKKLIMESHFFSFSFSRHDTYAKNFELEPSPLQPCEYGFLLQ